MKRSLMVLVSLLTLGVGTEAAITEKRPYTVQDLQALQKSESWNELIAHLLDVPPAQRNANWNRTVEAACTRRIAMESYIADYCFEPLKSVLASEPTNQAFAWKAGKWARLNMAHWSALVFFAKAGLKPGDARCKDDDVHLAIVSGLGQTDADAIRRAQDLGFQACWPETKATIMKNLKRGSYYADNTCPDLKKKGALSGTAVQSCTQ